MVQDHIKLQYRCMILNHRANPSQNKGSSYLAARRNLIDQRIVPVSAWRRFDLISAQHEMERDDDVYTERRRRPSTARSRARRLAELRFAIRQHAFHPLCRSAGAVHPPGGGNCSGHAGVRPMKPMCMPPAWPSRR